MLQSSAGPTQSPAVWGQYRLIFRGGKPIKALVAMRNEDSTLDLSLLKSARVAGVKPNSLDIAGFSLGEKNAFRFQPVAAVTPAGVDAVLGVSALRNFTITIWPQPGQKDHRRGKPGE